MTVQSAEWLTSAILAVANGAATAAGQAVEHISRSAILVLQEAIQQALVGRFAASRVTPNAKRAGVSGRAYEFDFAVSDAGHSIIDAVTPYANSINSKYTAFADVGSLLEKRGPVVFDRPLEPLLSEVADVVPLRSLTERIARDLPSLAV